MSKNKKKQQKKALATIAKSNSATITPPTAKHVAATPTAAPPKATGVPSASASAPKVAVPPAAVPAAQPAPQPTPKAAASPTAESVNGATVVEIKYDTYGKPLSGKLLLKDGTFVYLHGKVSPIPEIGSVVEFESYEFNQKLCGKVTKVIGTDQVIKKFHDAIAAVKYKLVSSASILALRQDDPNIIGMTEDGFYVYCIS